MRVLYCMCIYIYKCSRVAMHTLHHHQSVGRFGFGSFHAKCELYVSWTAGCLGCWTQTLALQKFIHIYTLIHSHIGTPFTCIYHTFCILYIVNTLTHRCIPVAYRNDVLGYFCRTPKFSIRLRLQWNMLEVRLSYSRYLFFFFILFFILFRSFARSLFFPCVGFLFSSIWWV